MSGFASWVDGEVGFDTKLVHSSVSPDPLTGAILTPIFQSTTFVQESVANYLCKGYSYSRTSNPTVRTLEGKIADLEGGKDCVTFGTGQAATVTLLSAVLKPGDHCLITNCSYGGTNRVCRIHFSKYNIDFDFIDMTNIENIKKNIKSNTKLIYTETPANPTLTLIDIYEVSKICKEKNIILACDSTFATPCIMKCNELGVDYNIISLTKFYDGHNMATGGAIVSKSLELDEVVRFHRNMLGSIISPQVAFYYLQTVKTMSIRVERQSRTAYAIATFLEKHPKIDKVSYPGLATFAQRELAIKQHTKDLHGGMLWFEVKGGTEAGRKLMDTIQRPWSLCENLGAAESIITCPAVFTHANMTSEDRKKVGITDGFVRVSCGLEDVDDLIRSLDVALKNI
eukprot:GHVL01004417.1.p1 GENE.GHVL01004417.1~~GHVL01004417.1.p1  ORF type:complete len:398 (+),score=69.15 GHVL01004417.1:45-1238(+)